MGKKGNTASSSSKNPRGAHKRGGHNRGRGSVARDFDDTDRRPESAIDAVDDGEEDSNDDDEGSKDDEESTKAVTINVPVAMWVSVFASISAHCVHGSTLRISIIVTQNVAREKNWLAWV